jgi:acyl transferase domain-containing protein
MLSIQEQRRRIAEELERLSRLKAGRKSLASAPAARLPVPEGELEPIAIIGLSGCLPGCQSVDAFWRALDEDRCLLEAPPPERLALWNQLQPGWSGLEGRGIPGGGFIPDIRGFAPEFFGVLPGQAHGLDPRQRLLLMSVYHTLEDAGYAPGSLKQKPVGVFVGIEEDEYFQTLQDLGLPPSGGDGLAASMVANRISWFFDFRGPSEVVNTMCSGAAVALHRAVGSLRLGESSMALVGAANLMLRPEPFMQLIQTGQLSPDLSIHSFGRGAQGFLRADGVASVLLKRLSQAEADGDPIYAVIRHTATNYNGKGGMSIAAPDIAAHAELIERCYRQAGIDPREVRYIEAQGMGQPVADLAEWQACNRALSKLAG